jgi:hypothetical protein
VSLRRHVLAPVPLRHCGVAPRGLSIPLDSRTVTTKNRHSVMCDSAESPDKWPRAPRRPFRGLRSDRQECNVLTCEALKGKPELIALRRKRIIRASQGLTALRRRENAHYTRS